MTKAVHNYPLSVCKREFQSLIDEYKFKPIRYPKWDLINVFRYGLTNGIVTIFLGICELEDGGYLTLVFVHDNYGNEIGIGALLPRGMNHHYGYEIEDSPLLPRGRRYQLHFIENNGQHKSLEEQIFIVVQQLRVHAQDVLNGDLTRFNKIVEKEKKILGLRPLLIDIT
jgi:hypothetical protein